MKRELIAAALLLALLALSFLNVRYMENKTSALAADIEAADGLYGSGDAESAAGLVEDSLNGWLSWKSYTHIMLRHSEIDVVTCAYYELLEKLESGEKVPEASFESLITTLGDIVDKESIALGSLL